MIPIALFKSNTLSIPKQVKITFSGTPSNVIITPTYYKYNKQFAISYGFDDGNLDQYQVVLPMYNGGTIIYQDGNTPNYPGLYYTDGVGNKKAFSGTFNLNMSNITNNPTPTSIMNYNMLQEAYIKGIDLTNHSYTHRSIDNGGWSVDQATMDSQVLGEIDLNYTALKDNTGIKFMNFTSPANDNTYDSYTINYLNAGKLKTVCNINNTSHYPAHQYTTEYWIARTGLGVSRDFLTWTDGAVTRTPSDFDVIANKLISVGNQHAWFTFATHRVNLTESLSAASTTMKYLSFKWIMEGLESRYGASGNDTMWFTSINDVYEYLICARDVNLNSIQSGVTTTISFDFSKIPQEFKSHSLSFLISANTNISNITYTGFDEQGSLINYQSLGNNTALVNVGYKPEYEKALSSRLNAIVSVNKLEVSQSQTDLNIAQALVTLLTPGSFRDSLQIRINAVIVIPDALIMQIDFGRNISGYILPFPWNTFGSTTPGLTVGSKLSGLSTTTSVVTNINLEVVKPFLNYDSNVSFTASTTALPLPFPYEACRDCFSVSGGTIAKLRLTNLDITKLYDFSFYAARGFVGNLSQYTITGATGTTTVSIAHKTNITGTTQILNVVPNISGFLDIDIRGDASNIGYINVMQLTQKIKT